MRRFWMLLLTLMICALPALAEQDDFLFGEPEDAAEPPVVEEAVDSPPEAAEPDGADEPAQAEATPQPAADQNRSGNLLEPTPDVGEAVYLVVSAAGDVTIGRDTRKSADIFSDELKKQGGDLAFPFRNVQEYFANDDLTIVNFEGTLTNTKSATENRFSFGSPPEHVEVLHLGSIEAVALENNHMMDHGQQGLLDTQQTLRDAGIPFSGFGEKGTIEVQGVKVGMLSFQTFDGRYDSIYRDMPGMIQELRGEGCALVIVSYHWGAEREYQPNDNQQKLGRATVDAGADLVLGHHSHCLQPIERYNGKYIVYSLGNFSFAGNTKPEDFDTIIFQQRFMVLNGEAKDDGMRIVPCSISSQSSYNDFTPTPYDAENAARVAKKLLEYGSKLPYGIAEYPLDWGYPSLVE